MAGSAASAARTAAGRPRLNTPHATVTLARDWHKQAASDVAASLGVDPANGLAIEEVERRLTRFGANALTARTGTPAWLRLARQLTAPLVMLLVVAGSVSALLGEFVDATVIFGVVIINATVGFIQEGRAEHALAALARRVITQATVLRDKLPQRIDAAGIVPGDIVLLGAGDHVPADLRLIQVRELLLQESTLTGESMAVEKHPAHLPQDTLLADRRNMAYAGTAAVQGQGAGVVVATGEATELGRISRLIAAAPELATPLTRRIERFSHLLLWVIVVLAAATFAVGLARGEGAGAMFMAAVALAVAAIPEGLPAALTITLAIGVASMARRNAIIRKLPAVEALGSTTVICTDKTGTLTQNRMSVEAIHADNAADKLDCLRAAVLCNDAAIPGGREIGDPTEIALLVAARDNGIDIDALRANCRRIDVLPFDARHQYMATLDEGAERGIEISVKGALERVLGFCRNVDHVQIEAEATALAAQGMRVLAFARGQPNGALLSRDALQGALSYIGLVGMMDPPRPESAAAVAECRKAGVRVVMITGDHAVTAQAIATQVGIAGANAAVLTGRQLAPMDDAGWRKAAGEINVFARVEPEQKLKLVQALQHNGDIVAMTGDGVNDAPALKTADIGVAMGLGGTDVAREAAAMVITDDNFATIVAAVREGRGVYDNLLKFITWTLPTNIAEGLVILVAIGVGTQLPITPLQILWVNMMTALLLGLMLAFEPIEHDVMSRPPRPPQAPIFDATLALRIALVGLITLAGAFGMFLFEMDRGASVGHARTAAVNVFVAVEITYLFNCRSLTTSPGSVGWFSNVWVWVGAIGMALLQLLFTYAPPLQRAFHTEGLDAASWAIIVAVAVVAYFVVELEKRLNRR